MHEFTLITTFYSQPAMLRRHLEEWAQYPPEVSIILVDDGSPIPALPVVEEHAPYSLLSRLSVYRVLVDIPWARSTARNLAMQETKTPWALVLDIDHVFPATCAQRLLAFTPTEGRWYRLPRFRRGRADDTRNKDALPRHCTYGPIKPHIDGYLIERGLFWDVGGYHQIFNGSLGGGSEFLARLEKHAPMAMLPDDIFVEVYTQDVIPDASVTGLSRDPAEYRRRRKLLERGGSPKPTEVVTLPWERVL